MKILKAVFNEMVAHAKQLAPVESCGYLAGKDGQATRFYPMTNVDNSPEHFSFDPKEQFKVLKEARNDGLTLLSVYHSHPESPARLSEEDVRLLYDPAMVYIIVSLMGPKEDVKGYRIRKPDEKSVEIDRVNLELI